MNELVVHDQSVKSNSVMVSMVNAEKAGWIVISTDQNGQPGTVLGYTAVPAGISSNVKVTIDSSKATDKMIAMLHIDAGKLGVFEYPGYDEPIKNGNENVLVIFNQPTTAYHLQRLNQLHGNL